MKGPKVTNNKMLIKGPRRGIKRVNIEDFHQLSAEAENCFLWSSKLSLSNCWIEFPLYLIHLHKSNILLAERDRYYLSQRSENQVLFNFVRQLGQGKLIVSVKKLMTQWRLPLPTQIVEIIW